MTPENDEKLRQFNAEWDRRYSTDDTKPPMEVGKNGAIAAPGNGNLMESIQRGAANLMPNTTPYVPAAIPTTGDNCPQCGTMHPPIRPGETCPVAAAMKGNQPTAEPTTTPTPAPEPVVNAVVEPLTEGNTKTEVKPVNETPVRPVQPPPAPVSNTETLSEPAPLADNNIPTEIHVNKYLGSWGQQIDIYCKNNNIKNVKKLMRHLTIEVTNFLDYYKEV